MSRGVAKTAEAECSRQIAADSLGTAAWSKSRRLSRGSIDYDLYRALARELREEFIGQVASSLGHQMVRLVDLVLASTAAMGCGGRRRAGSGRAVCASN
jgi:hypothetical protein